MPPVELIETRDYDDFVLHPSYFWTISLNELLSLLQNYRCLTTISHISSRLKIEQPLQSTIINFDYQ